MIAAIDVGSNAMRLAIASVGDDHRLEPVENVREPVRLGQDVFTRGAISEETTQRTVKAFEKLRRLMDQHGVKRWRAVATSAMREAHNRDDVVARVAQATGIEITVIGAGEEARLVHLAVASQVQLKNKLAVLIDIGGGSVEVIVVADGQIVATESFRMGAVRLLQELEQPRVGERRFNQLVREYVDATRKRLKKEIGNQKIDLCVGTGGNVEALGDLRRQRFRKDNGLLKADDLEELIKEMQAMTCDERMRQWDLRPDRADVIVPAAIVLQKVMKQAGADEILIPHVGLKDGLLLDLVEEVQDETKRSHREQVMSSALQLGRKYALDEQHGTTVARFALQLFDDTRALHKLEDEYRLLLEVAALLHEIGSFVEVTGHHKHSCYLLLNSPLIGLTDSQRAIVANVARYHRKAPPSLQHEPYRDLSAKERSIVSRLAALLRIADALDKEHGGKLTSLEVKCGPRQLTLRLQGDGDLLLERWAIEKKSELFEEVFGVKVVAQD